MANPGGIARDLNGGDPRIGSSARCRFGESQAARPQCHVRRVLRYAAIMRANYRTVVPAHTDNIYTV